MASALRKTELDILIEEIYERNEASVQLNLDEDEKIRKKVEKEKERANDVRLLAMVTMNPNQKKTQDLVDKESGNSSKKKRRSYGSETVAFLREKGEREEKFREKELELKSKSQEMETKKQEQMDCQHQGFMKMLTEQQQQQHPMQQQQMQQFQAMLNQQQQQNQLLAPLLTRKNFQN